MPVPTAQERPCAFAERVGAWYLSSNQANTGKRMGCNVESRHRGPIVSES